MRRFCTVNNNQLIHDVCILLFRYPPILHFIPWTWSRQPGELSTKASFPSQLTVYALFSCELGGSKISSPACRSISIVTFFSTSLLTREKNPDCRLPAASTYWEPCVSIYCTWLLNGLLYLKNKQVDISTTFCFQKLFRGCVTLVTILIMMKLLLCQKARMPLLYHSCHEETIAESHHTLQSEVEEVYKKNGREIKENWTCL